ncbi:MAG: hypothetical protein LBT60_04770 [Oscillospiraceae bacterium]|jgi:hypothetical protein|nr:hypothetical protein [Oscillospiraceae bacterium]
MKKQLTALLCLAALFLLTACGPIGDTISDLIRGDVACRVGETYTTSWFSFTVLAVETPASYAGYTPPTGYTLVDVTLSESCAEGSQPMGTFDFYLNAPAFPDYIYPLDPLDETMMPTAFTLTPDTPATYHMLYQIPADTTGLRLTYTEMDADNRAGAAYTIDIPDERQ